MRNQGQMGLSCMASDELGDGQMVAPTASDQGGGESAMNLQMPIPAKNLHLVPSRSRTSLSSRRSLGKSVTGCALCSTVKLPANTVCTICGEASTVPAVDVLPDAAHAVCAKGDIATAGWHELVLLPLLEAVASGAARPEDAGPALRDLRSMLLKRNAETKPNPPATLRRRTGPKNAKRSVASGSSTNSGGLRRGRDLFLPRDPSTAR